MYLYMHIYIFTFAGATSTVTAEERKRWAESINVTIVGDDGDVKIPGGWSPQGNHRWNRNTQPRPDKFSKLTSLVIYIYTYYIINVYVSKLVIWSSSWGWCYDFIG